MSLYNAITEIKGVFEKDIFIPASQEEVNKRRENMVSDDDVIQLEEEILELARGEADDIYRQLEKQFDYLVSDEGIAEELQGQEKEFDVDPATGRLDEAKNVFKSASKKEVVNRVAAAKAARIKTGRVLFDDLTDEDKETVIRRYQDDSDYPGYDWWEGDIGHTWRDREGKLHQERGYYDEQLEEKGFEDTELHFSGFGSQGDGACFECRLNVKRIVEHYKINLRPIVLTAVNNGMFYGKITTSNSHYSHSNTMDINLEYEGVSERKVQEAGDVFKPASQEELMARQGINQYKSLNDIHPAGDTEIWYFKSTGTDTKHGQEADLMMGYKWCRKKGCLPDPNDLEKTHVLLGKVNLKGGPNNIYNLMQGEHWSPNGEARNLIRSKGLEHTSMSVGDIVKTGDDVFMIDNLGYVNLKHPGPEDLLEQEEHNVFQPASQEELEQRPGWAEAEQARARHQEEYEDRRRRIEQSHLTRPDSLSLIQQWLNGTRDKGRAASLTVKGDVLISYGTPIAIRGDGGTAYMVDQKFSVTTSKQQSFVRRIASDVIKVPVPEFKQMLDAKHIDYGSSWLHEDVFKPASKAELAKRQTAWQKELAGKGVKITYEVKPMPDRLGSFWYDGLVAEITYKAPDGESRLISVEAHGDIRVTFVGSDTSYSGWNAVEEAMDRGYTDEDLGDADYEEPAGVYHGKVTDWDMNNWFEFMYGSSKWEGREDIMGDTYGSYDEALQVAVEVITDDELWHDLTRQFVGESKVTEKDVFKPASAREINKRIGADKDHVWVIRDQQGAGMHEEEFFSSPEAIRQHLASYHSVDWEGENDDGSVTDIESMSLNFLLDYGGWDIDKISRKDLPADAEVLNEADVFQPAGEEELRARGSLKYLPKSGQFDYKFLKHIDDPDSDATSWKIVGMGNYFDYENSNIYFYNDGEPEFNLYYDTEIIMNDNMELDTKLTAEIQATNMTDEEWVASKGWEKEYSGYTGNEDPGYYWGYGDFSYVSFEAAKDEHVLGGAVVTFRGQEPKVYLGDLDDVFGALNQSDPKQDIADMFGYEHYENLVYDIKKYCGTLTEEDEQKSRRPEPVHGQLNWNLQSIHPDSTFTESKINEEDEEEENVFKLATKEEMKQRTAEFDRMEKERKAKRSAATKAYYAGIPYTYEDIVQLPIYKKIMGLEGVEDATTHLQKAHKTTTFKLRYVDRQDPDFAKWSEHILTGAVNNDAKEMVPYYVHAYGYLRSASYGGETSVLHKYEPAQTLEAYGQLLEEMYKIISKRLNKEQTKPPFKTRYDCAVCSAVPRLWQNKHNYGTVLGNKHLKDPLNIGELERLQSLAKQAGTELEL